MDGIIDGCASITLGGEGPVLCTAKCSCPQGGPQSGKSYFKGYAKYFAVFVKES